jgi:hypothetical protein
MAALAAMAVRLACPALAAAPVSEVSVVQQAHRAVMRTVAMADLVVLAVLAPTGTTPLREPRRQPESLAEVVAPVVRVARQRSVWPAMVVPAGRVATEAAVAAVSRLGPTPMEPTEPRQVPAALVALVETRPQALLETAAPAVPREPAVMAEFPLRAPMAATAATARAVEPVGLAAAPPESTAMVAPVAPVAADATVEAAVP